MSNSPANIAYGRRVIRTVFMNGVPKFSATDICNILGFFNPNKTLGRYCDSTPEYIRMDTPGGPQNLRVIGVDDLYAIFKRCRRSNRQLVASRLRNWLENELLPAVSLPDVLLVCTGCGAARK